MPSHATRVGTGVRTQSRSARALCCSSGAFRCAGRAARRLPVSCARVRVCSRSGVGSRRSVRLEVARGEHTTAAGLGSPAVDELLHVRVNRCVAAPRKRDGGWGLIAVQVGVGRESHRLPVLRAGDGRKRCSVRAEVVQHIEDALKAGNLALRYGVASKRIVAPLRSATASTVLQWRACPSRSVCGALHAHSSVPSREARRADGASRVPSRSRQRKDGHDAAADDGGVSTRGRQGVRGCCPRAALSASRAAPYRREQIATGGYDPAPRRPTF